MRPVVAQPRIYPVDRYLVESSNKIEMVDLDDDIWQSEPALRPEDELILRRLHDMLQSTADDLKLLSGELNKFHEPKVQIKTQPMPLDEEFNEKVHIEEIVKAKFHGYKIVDKPITTPSPPKELKSTVPDRNYPKQSNIPQHSENRAAKRKPTKILTVTRPKIIEIKEKLEDKKVPNAKLKVKPTVVYNEYAFQYVEPDEEMRQKGKFTIQDMPRIDIRSELREQKVLQLDIVPESSEIKEISSSKSNVAVISVEHAPIAKPVIVKPPVTNVARNDPKLSYTTTAASQPVRKVSKMSSIESSESNNASSDTQHNVKTQKHLKSVLRSSPRNTARIDRNKTKKLAVSKKEQDKRTHFSADEWKRKLNSVYGPSTSRTPRDAYRSKVKPVPPKSTNITPRGPDINRNVLNNSEYVPYSQLTLGGVRVSDIEREISDLPIKSDLPLSPLLDKIMSSRENTPRKSKTKHEKEKIFTTSDENLLEEVLDIERKVTKTVAKTNLVNELVDESNEVLNEQRESEEKDSYADDFEEDKSENTEQEDKSPSSKSQSERSANKSIEGKNTSDSNEQSPGKSISKKKSNIHNRTYTKASNLSFKNSVDVFEFVHTLDTEEIAIQSNATQTISLKETQTSPRNENQTLQPIHNVLWPAMDPKGDVEKMFELEKDFIKKLIIDEYGDILEKNLAKPSTSKDVVEGNKERNVSASQKNTQTSPAHVKSVMTSPTKTKTRTTSPFLSLHVDHQTSPMIVVTNERELTVELDDDEEGISVNLSSPRFSLRLPQTSREIISNLEDSAPGKTERKDKAPNPKTFRRSKNPTSSSSVEGENSSDISSIGEVNLKLRKKQKKRTAAISESSSSSTVSKYSSSDFTSVGVLPLRSEGEVSLGQVGRKALKKVKSEGEASAGRSK